MGYQFEQKSTFSPGLGLLTIVQIDNPSIVPLITLFLPPGFNAFLEITIFKLILLIEILTLEYL
jgi:hypothetical protein